MAPALLRAARDGGLVLLVCDLNMPGTSGIEFCKVVRRYVDSAAIIIFSGDLSVCEPAEIEAIDATPSARRRACPRWPSSRVA